MNNQEIVKALPESVIIQLATLSEQDRSLIQKCRGQHNRLGFAYQLMFVKVFNYFPNQSLVEIQSQIITFAILQLGIKKELINAYQKRQQTVSEHQQQIRNYLKLSSFDKSAIYQVSKFLFIEAQRTDHVSILLIKTEQFLKEQYILQPARDTLERLIIIQRQKARQFIYDKILINLTEAQSKNLDELLKADESRISPLQQLKQPPAKPSPKALIALTQKLELIHAIDIAKLDTDWLNNNYQRSLTKYVLRCSAKRLRDLQASHRYTALICFLKQLNLDTIDYIIDMHHKLMLKVYNRADMQMNEALRKQRKHFKQGQIFLNTIAELVLDSDIEDTKLRTAIFNKVNRKTLEQHLLYSQDWLKGKFSHLFHLVVERFSYLRQFSPALIAHLKFEAKGERATNLLKAIELLHELNQQQKRKLPDDAPIDFIPKKLRSLVKSQGILDKPAWESALLTSIRDEMKIGNLTVKDSKRFGNFDNFFMPYTEWQKERIAFFKRAGLPVNPQNVKVYLTERLNKAFDTFLTTEPYNTYAKVKNGKWALSIDQAEENLPEEKESLNTLQTWLKKHMRSIKLPQLLIEVDNDLGFTQGFMLPHQQVHRQVDDVCTILVSIMAHGCFIGPYTMARLTEGITYDQIRHITDWQLSEENQRSVLAMIVNAITNLDISKQWGDGKTSSSDAQRYSYSRRTLQQTYSTKFCDFALEFYTFVADNYAPYFSLPIECTDRDSPYVMDGILYNESDLVIEEHYVDSHGYTEINYAAFAMIGKKLSPRIRGVQHQRLYRIDDTKNYSNLVSLIAGKDQLIHMDWIEDQWDKIGHFYASLASGHTTASTALKRLTGFSPKNHFYRANRELGRIFKTENILTYMSDPLLRQNRRRGLLKGEQLHQLAREVAYGKRGRISANDLHAQRNTCSCLTLIITCIIYWQAKEITQLIKRYSNELDDRHLAMLPYISPIGWDNIILREFRIHKVAV
ncbi:Tn3 family transposase [Rickettsia endosymbiont of Nabis limbatus]|uniref:Tn3 family transposase n=1 Tax=Rickettsia endosymbiont of Nabis limbatus TaxID=3066268 RepID=UPI003AF3572C